MIGTVEMSALDWCEGCGSKRRAAVKAAPRGKSGSGLSPRPPGPSRRPASPAHRCSRPRRGRPRRRARSRYRQSAPPGSRSRPAPPERPSPPRPGLARMLGPSPSLLGKVYRASSTSAGETSTHYAPGAPDRGGWPSKPDWRVAGPSLVGGLRHLQSTTSSSAHRREACPRSWLGTGRGAHDLNVLSSVHRVRPECSRRATDRWRLANSIAFDPNGSAWVSDVRETSHGGTEREERHADRSPREGEGHRVAPCRRTHV